VAVFEGLGDRVLESQRGSFVAAAVDVSAKGAATPLPALLTRKSKVSRPQRSLSVCLRWSAKPSKDSTSSVWGPVGVPVVDRLVAASPERFLRAVIAERRERGGVREPDHVIGIHNPDRLPDRLQHRGERILSTDVQAGQISEGTCHAKPLRTVQSTLNPERRSQEAPKSPGLRSRYGASRSMLRSPGRPTST